MNKFSLAGFASELLKQADIEKIAPFKSEAQRRLFYAKARRGEISRATVKEWERHTPKGKKLPERVKAASYGGSCPVCGGNAVVTCRCSVGDSACASGHEWHYKNGQAVVGPSPHGGGMAETAKRLEAEKTGMFLQADLLKKVGRGEMTIAQMNAEMDRRQRAKTAAMTEISEPTPTAPPDTETPPTPSPEPPPTPPKPPMKPPHHKGVAVFVIGRALGWPHCTRHGVVDRKTGKCITPKGEIRDAERCCLEAAR